MTAPAAYLAQEGRADVRQLAVDRSARVDVTTLQSVIDQDVGVVSVMHAHNETGTCSRWRRCPPVPAPWAPDAFGRCTNPREGRGRCRCLGVDLLTIAGHKLYAPKGVGALYVRRGVSIDPLLHGGGQERGARAGTENVPYIVGLGRAAALATERGGENPRHRRTRDRLQAALATGLGERFVLVGDPVHRLPNTLYACVTGVRGADLLARCPGLCASTGSACHADVVELSASCARSASRRPSGRARFGSRWERRPRMRRLTRWRTSC